MLDYRCRLPEMRDCNGTATVTVAAAVDTRDMLTAAGALERVFLGLQPVDIPKHDAV